jgi:hypothetical protein
MRDAKKTKRKGRSSAQTARHEGAPNIVMDRAAGTVAGANSATTVDAGDPETAEEITEIADQVHANA